MKNAIKYYYNFEPIDIHFLNNSYFFSLANQFYVLYICNLEEKDIQKIYDLQKKLLENNIYVHQIILNRDRNIFTMIDGKKYILMEMYDEMNNKINEDMVVLFNEETSHIFTDNRSQISWKNLWEQKIDYFEYQVNQFGKKFAKIRQSFSYFVGMTELGISLLTNFNSNAKLSISHRRINKDSTTFDLYNPFNFIIDYKIRDICEYFKYSFIRGEDVFEKILKYFSISNLTLEEIYLFFTRMFFPSFYFDYYEGIMSKYFNENIVDESTLNNIDEIAIDYEKLLKKIYHFVKGYISIPKIDWLEN